MAGFLEQMAQQGLGDGSLALTLEQVVEYAKGQDQHVSDQIELMLYRLFRYKLTPQDYALISTLWPQNREGAQQGTRIDTFNNYGTVNEINNTNNPSES